MKILKESESLLLNRKRITVSLEHLGAVTPKKEALKQEIAAKYKAAPELVSVRHIYTKFGRGQSKAIAHIYTDPKDFEFFEVKKKKEKKK
jgi:ribosomal protein S24E